MLNSSTYTPTDAELQQMVYGSEYHVPESQEVQQHAQREQHADFARWEQEVKEGGENDFVLGYDEIDPNLFGADQEPMSHEGITAAEQTQQSPEERRNYDLGKWMESLDNAGIVKDIASVTPVVVYRRDKTLKAANQ